MESSWKIFCILFLFDCVKVFVSGSLELYTGGTLQTPMGTVLHILGEHTNVVDNAKGETYDVFGIITDEGYALLRVAAPILEIKNPKELEGNKPFFDVVLVPPSNMSNYPQIRCDVLIYPQVKMNVVRFGSDPETGSRGGKIVDKNNNIVVALEDYRGSIVTAEIFKGRYNNQPVLVFLEVAHSHGSFLIAEKPGDIVLLDVKLKKTGQRDISCNVLMSPIAQNTLQNPKKFMGGTLRSVYSHQICLALRHIMSTTALEFYDTNINGTSATLRIEALSSDSQTLRKLYLNENKLSAGRFFPSVYLYTPSTTEKVLCNAFLVPESLAISPETDPIVRHLLTASKIGAVWKTLPSRTSGSGATLASTSSATTANRAIPYTPPMNIIEASKYNGGKIVSHCGITIAEDLKYKLPVDEFEFFEAIYNGNNKLFIVAITSKAKQKLRNETRSGEYHADVFLWSAPSVRDLPEVKCEILIVNPTGHK